MKKKKINLLSKNRRVISTIFISELNLSEDYIYRVSNEKYNNSEPCIIIKGKIANSLFCKWNEFINECSKRRKEIIELNEIPNDIKEGIIWEEGVEFIGIV